MVWKGRANWMARLAALIGGFTASTPAFAQGCAMCYTTASAARAAAIQALRSGILILLIPPVLMVVGIFVRALRSRERFEDPDFDREWSAWQASLPLADAVVSPAEAERAATGASLGEEYAAKLSAPPKADPWK